MSGRLKPRGDETRLWGGEIFRQVVKARKIGSDDTDRGIGERYGLSDREFGLDRRYLEKFGSSAGWLDGDQILIDIGSYTLRYEQNIQDAVCSHTLLYARGTVYHDTDISNRGATSIKEFD